MAGTQVVTAEDEARALAGALEVRRFRPREDDARDRFVAEHARGRLFQLAGWRRAVERVFGHEPRDLCAWRGQELVGLLPLSRCRGLLGRSHLISVPYGVYAGPLGADRAVERALVDEAVRAAEAEGVGRLELRCLEDPGLEHLAASDLYATFRRRLPDDPAEVLMTMRKDERRLVRRARDRHGLELCEGSWYVADLARLFHASKHRLGSPGLPAAWFQALADELGERAVVHLARRAGRALAASMSFVHGDALAMYYIGTTPEANREYATTSFMIAGLQEWAVARGLRTFDLGRSRRGSGAFTYKVNQGFEPTPLHYRYALVKSAGPPIFTPSNPRTRLLRKAWSRLPQWLSLRLSERLARRLP